MLFDAPFESPYYPDLVPDIVLGFEKCEKPAKARDKSRPPAAGDTVFINRTCCPAEGFWAVLKEELQ